MKLERTRLNRIGRELLPFVALLGALLFLIWPTVGGIVSRWFKFDQAYSHGLLLTAVSIFLVVRSIRRNPVAAGFYPLWILPLVLALSAYGLGEIMRVQALSELVVVPLILGCLATLLGWRQLRHLIIPIGILFLAVPVWDYLAWTLQIITVEINRLILGLLGVNFRVEGIFVHLIGVGVFEVAHGCSGLRYLLVGQLLALLYGELNLQQVRSKIWLYLTAVALALVANWIRVFVIIFVGYESNMESNLINEHDNFGWLVFAFTLVPLFLIGRALERMEAVKTGNRVRSENADDEVKCGHRFGAGPQVASFVLVAGLMVFARFILPSESEYADVDTEAHNAVFVPEQHWLPLFTRSIAGWAPVIERPDRFMERSYTSREGLDADGGTSETLFVGLYSYDVQRADHELVNYNNRLYDASRFVAEEVFEIDLGNGRSMSGMTLKPVGSEIRIHLAFGYYVEGRWENNELQAKLAQLPGIFNARTDASLIVVGLQCSGCARRERLGEVSAGIWLKAQAYLDDLY